MTQPLPGEHAMSAENELDIRGLFRTLWAGKVWIVGMALAFALSLSPILFCPSGVERNGYFRQAYG
jgi:LPS O-antigen subunit length determinant protein (WzzB/FepE family)